MQIQQTFNNLSSYSNFNKTSLNQESAKDSKQQNSTIYETKANGEPLSNSEKQYISKLESIDRNVKAHEAAIEIKPAYQFIPINLIACAKGACVSIAPNGTIPVNTNAAQTYKIVQIANVPIIAIGKSF